MDKKKIIIIILSALLMVAIICRFYVDYKNKDEAIDNEIKVTENSKKFKQEYESLNNTKNDSGLSYLNVSIPEANKVVYKTEEEIVDTLNNGTGLVYFGYNTCPWCRSMVETLVKVSNERNINLYYVDIKDMRSSFKVEKKKLVKTKEGSEEYYQILEALDEYLTDYIIEDNNKEYDTKEKRLYAPTVFALKDGEVVDVHVDTVESQENPYDGLNDDQRKELEKIYQKMVDNIQNANCGQRGC
ncbi:MAG: hypothetical protein NC483_04440 [Ruminococcus sp.]|nr:hypothetical protein [Ruminococcus sp.]